MARYQKLDRDKMLEAAEALILKEGAHALSIGGVAKQAGVSKGGIQSTFGTREGLVQALFERWGDALDRAVLKLEKEHGADFDPFHLFLKATLETHHENPHQDAAMMFLLLKDSQMRERSHQWVMDKVERFELHGEEGRQRRLKFVVTQALAVIRSLEMMPFSKEEWQEIFNDADEVTNPD